MHGRRPPCGAVLYEVLAQVCCNASHLALRRPRGTLLMQTVYENGAAKLVLLGVRASVGRPATDGLSFPQFGSSRRREPLRHQQISGSRGEIPVWRVDGRETVYIGEDNQIRSIRPPSLLSQSRLLAVTRDGSRILFANRL